MSTRDDYPAWARATVRRFDVCVLGGGLALGLVRVVLYLLGVN